MVEIDRILVVLKPTEIFLTWVNSLDDGQSEPFLLESLQADATALLIPYFDDPNDAMTFIENNFERIFVSELEGWWTEQADWPPVTLALFLEMFDLDFHTVIYDMASREEYELSMQNMTIQ
jgi:hypothetical protein